LANLHQSINKPNEALSEHWEALKIRRELAKKNPDTYLPDVAITLNNLAIFYLKIQPNRKHSIAYAEEAKAILQPYKHIPHLAQHFSTSVKLLILNGIF
jgi:hypothetical protein